MYDEGSVTLKDIMYFMGVEKGYRTERDRQYKKPSVESARGGITKKNSYRANGKRIITKGKGSILETITPARVRTRAREE